VRALISIALATAATLLSAPAALANTTSTNWAGYAIHRPHTSFRSVEGTWTQPNAQCTPGVRTYSSFWVGLGGFNLTSNALEQVGTEVDCKASGAVHTTAWYELVPAPSIQLRMTVHPGDVMRARVAVSGHRVQISLFDVTRNRGFHKTLNTPYVDVASAEWIVEAPSECLGSKICESLPLANFGSATFSSAIAHTIKGHVGSISHPGWNATEIQLVPDSRRFVSQGLPQGSVATATPSSLSPDGQSFAVNYAEVSVSAAQPSARAARSAPATLVGSIVPR
jgi:Peptidase A4 family